MAILTRVLVPVGIGLGLASQAAAQAVPRASATEVRAAYLLNFARYVEWPASVMGDSTAPLVVCVVGSAAMEDALRGVAEGQTVRGHRVRIESVPSSEEAAGCQVSYVDPSAGAEGRSLEVRWSGRPVLTVGEGDDFLAGGGMIGFVPVGQTVRFTINQEAAQRAGLRVSSRVLALAVPRQPAR